MTGARLPIRTEEHTRLSVSRPPSWPNPAAGPSMPEDAERPEAALAGMPAPSAHLSSGPPRCRAANRR
jgi:hypothetical protein